MKIPLVGPDVEQAISHTLKLTFSHNFVPLILGLACLGSLFYLIAKPSRVRVFLLMGFVLILGYVEYIKHIQEPLLNQTLVTLTTETPRYTFQWIVEKMITRGIPIILLVGGWGSLIGSFVYIIKTRKDKKKKHEKNP